MPEYLFFGFLIDNFASLFVILRLSRRIRNSQDSAIPCFESVRTLFTNCSNADAITALSASLSTGND